MPETSTNSGATTTMSLWARLSTLQRFAAIASIVVMVGAITLQVIATTNGANTANDPISATPSGTPLPPNSLVQGFGATDGTPRTAPSENDLAQEQHALDRWSPAIFRTGFSFFVGFAIAFALRTFVKLSIIAIGFFFLALFGLQYAGFIEVNWGAIGDRYDSTRGWLGDQFSSFVNFATGYLPSAAAFTAGLFIGFRRKA